MYGSEGVAARHDRVPDKRPRQIPREFDVEMRRQFAAALARSRARSELTPRPAARADLEADAAKHLGADPIGDAIYDLGAVLRRINVSRSFERIGSSEGSTIGARYERESVGCWFIGNADRHLVRFRRP